jgi:fucose 4-O-acetylase-like acetyltransferase
MPLFFLISAYLFSHLGGFSHYGGCKGTLSEKFQRLILPYIIWNVAFFFPKILMSAYIPETVEFTPEYYMKLLFSPRDNILGHTWFLFALFEMFVLAIAFEQIRKHKEYRIPLLAILIIINCFGVTNRFFAIGDLMKNAIFFWIGLLLGSVNQDSIEKWAHNNRIYYSIVSLVCICTCIWIFNHDMLINTLILGIGIILLLGTLQIRYNIRFNFMEFISRNSFCIYILHWPILMIIRLIVYQHFHCAPILAMSLMFFGGIIIASSMAWVLRRFDANPVLKRINKIVFGL